MSTKNTCLFSFARNFVALVVLGVVIGMAAPAQADGPMGRQFGLGLAFGNPTSFAGKYHVGPKQAIDFHVGAFHTYGRSRYGDSLFLGGDYLFEVWNFVENGTVSVPFYAGPGLAIVSDLDDDDWCWDGDRRYSCRYYDFGFGPRMPIGVGVEFQKAPFELALEMSPTMLILFRDRYYDDEVDLDLDIINFAFIGRFYF